MVIGAHPDDCDFGAGATTAAWTHLGWSFDFVCVTDGSRGTRDGQARRDLLAHQRRSEQEASARLLGARAVKFLAFEDGAVTYGEPLLEAMVAVIRELAPEVVFTHTPDPLDFRPFDRSQGASVNHRDHRAVAQAVLDAVYPCARDPLFYPHLELPVHKVRRVYLWGAREADVKVECGAFLDLKVEALACHQSQFAERDWAAIRAAWPAYEAFQKVCL